MAVLYALSVLVFTILGILVVWIGNKVINSMKKDNCKTDVQIDEINDQKETNV